MALWMDELIYRTVTRFEKTSNPIAYGFWLNMVNWSNLLELGLASEQAVVNVQLLTYANPDGKPPAIHNEYMEKCPYVDFNNISSM